MNQREVENNKVTMSGHITDKLVYSHSANGEKFYKTIISVPRMSGTIDEIPLLLSEYLVDSKIRKPGTAVMISGQLRSFNCQEKAHRKLLLYFFVQELQVLDALDEHGENDVFLNGFICKKSELRVTPMSNRYIVDFVVAVNRPYNKSDYISCIAWGRSAKFISRVEVGAAINLHGRFQSRNYVKKYSDTESETKTAYELSVDRFRVERGGENEHN